MCAEGWLQKSYEFAGLRTAPATHRAKNIANSAFSCGMLQNAGFGTIPWGEGAGGPRAGTIYIFYLNIYIYIFINIIENKKKIYVKIYIIKLFNF